MLHSKAFRELLKNDTHVDWPDGAPTEMIYPEARKTQRIEDAMAPLWIHVTQDVTNEDLVELEDTIRRVADCHLPTTALIDELPPIHWPDSHGSPGHAPMPRKVWLLWLEAGRRLGW